MYYIQLFFLLIITQMSNACPTCIGRIDKNMPPFFSAEFDEHYNSSFTETEVTSDSNEESDEEEV